MSAIQRVLGCAFVWLVSTLAPVAAQAQPTLDTQFNPATIGPGAVADLNYTITNGSGVPVTDLAFASALPAGVSLVGSPTVGGGCSLGTLTAPDGGSTVTLADTAIGSGGVCAITVSVTSNTPGTHTLSAVTLNSSAGSSLSFATDLVVDATKPGFSKSLSSATANIGQPITVTYEVDNSGGASALTFMAFSETLPTGLVVASPSNATTTCNNAAVPNITATPGSNSLSLSSAGIAAGATCTVSVDIVATGAGDFELKSGTMTYSSGFVSMEAGASYAELTVSPPTGVGIVKSFATDPVLQGGTTTLEFTLTNYSRSGSATGITFTDDLDAMLSGATASALPATPCGAGSSLGGSGLLTFTGGELAAGASCSFSVTVNVPGAAAAGTYVNTTSAATATIGGVSVAGSSLGQDTLTVEALPVLSPPVLTHVFQSNPLLPGGSVDVVYTLTNPNGGTALSGLGFTVDYSQILGDSNTGYVGLGTGVLGGPTAEPNCGGQYVSIPNSTLPSPPFPALPSSGFVYSGGALAGGASCSFTITYDVGTALPNGVYTVDSSVITSNETTDGGPASTTFTVGAGEIGLALAKSFQDETAVFGDTVNIDFILTNGEVSASTISFTDNLETFLTGTTFSSVVSNGCGFSSISGTSTVTFTGGSVGINDSCTTTIAVQLGATAGDGTYTNTTSDLTASIGGASAAVLVNTPASDSIDLTGTDSQLLVFAKAFVGSPAIAGDTITLQYTITNPNSTSPAGDASSISFSDNLATVLPGSPDLTVTATPTLNTCGGTVTVPLPSLVSYSGGSVAAGASCVIELDVLVPAAAADGSFASLSGTLVSSLGLSPAASDLLVVQSERIGLAKSFTDDPVSPGDAVTLEFTLTNLDATRAATGIDFSDDLGAMLSGTVFDSVLLNNCGATVSGTTTDTITVTGASLAAAGSCTIRTSVTVPASAPVLASATNTTSGVTGTIASLPVTGAAATDNLVTGSGADLSFSKSFASDTVAGGAVVLQFDITNNSLSGSATNISFTDDLDAMLSGTVATSLSASSECGGGNLTGTSFLNFTGGSIAAGQTCTLTANLQVPASATAGSYTNVSSQLFSGGLPAVVAASATLNVEPAPTFAKVFAPDVVAVGQTSTLTFTVDNAASSLAASSLDFTDNLPAGVQVAAAPNASTTCTGGTLTAVGGAGTISYSGGTVAAGASCTVSVDVTPVSAGTFLNTTGDLTSSSGNSGSASDTLDAEPLPTFAKAFGVAAMAEAQTTTLTFTIDNSGSTLGATSLDFTDNLPAGLLVSSPSGASTTCTGGTLTAVAGTGTISYTGGAISAGATCTVTVNVLGASTGAQANTSGDLTSSVGNSGSASDTITIVPRPGFTKLFGPDAIGIAAAPSTLTFTIDNTGSILAASGLDFTDTLPAGMQVAATPNASTTCTGGTLTAVAGTGTISYTGGVIAAGASCTVQANVVGVSAGVHVNTTGDLTSSLGNSLTASDTLTVVAPPSFSKAFANSYIGTGQTTTLTFTIDNSASILAATALDFTDSFPSHVGPSVSDMEVASPANASTTCTGGTLTAIAGDGGITYTGGSLAAGATCTLSVDVAVTGPATFNNTSYDLTSSIGNSGTASDTLTAYDPLTAVQTFTPTTVYVDQASVLRFDISNSAPFVVSGLAFNHSLPAGLVIAATPNASTTCGSGTLTTVPGAGSFSYTGGTAPAASACLVEVSVVAPSTGSFASNLTTLTSELGDSAAVLATLTVQPKPTFTKVFAPDSILLGQDSTLTFTIDNSSATFATSGLDFTDNLPSGLVVATPSNASTTCTGGTLTATSGAGSITYTGAAIAASSVCTVTVDVTPANAGTFVNTTGDLTSPFGNFGSATDTLTVLTPEIGVVGSIGGAVADGGTLDQGTPDAGAQRSLVLTVANSGTSPLNLSAVPVISGETNVVVDSVTGPLATSAPVSGSTTITVLYTPGAGIVDDPNTSIPFSFDLSLGNDDRDENPYDITVSGTAQDRTAPSGYSVSFDQDPVTSGNQSATSFTFAGAEVGATYAYSITSDGGAGIVSGGGTIVTATDQITGIDLSSLPDGTLTLTVTLTDAATNTGADATDTTTKDATAPTGFSAAFDQDPVNIANQTAVSFTFAGAEVGATFAYRIESSANSAFVAGNGTILTATDQVTGIDVSALADGTLTLSVALTDPVGNASPRETDTTTKDATAPSLTIDTPIEGDGVVNAAEQSTVVISGTSNGLADGAVVTVNVGDSSMGLITDTATVAGGVWTVTLDLTALADGALSVSADASDAAGNPAPQATAAAAKDATAPAGYSVAFDQDPVNAANAAAMSFSFAAAEVGADFSYSITSDAGGTPVTGTGTIATATDAVTGLDLSGLLDGTLTLTVLLTDPAGNTGANTTATVTKDTAAPAVAFDTPVAGTGFVNAANVSAVALTGTTSGVADGLVLSVSVSDGGAGVATGTAGVAGGAWSLVIDLSGLADGPLTLTADVSDAAGNPAPQASASATKDTAAPTGYAATFDQDPVNIANQTAISFTFAGAEVGTAFAYTISSDGGGAPVTGTGSIVTATDQVTGLDLSGLGDGTLTLSVILTDDAGNAGSAVTDTATKDAFAPSLTIDTPIEGDDVINAGEAATVVLSGTSSDLADGTIVTISVGDSGAGSVTGTATVTGGLWSATLDLSGLADGTLDFAADASDAAGNPATQVTASATKDTGIPVVGIDTPIAGDDIVNTAEAAAVAVSGTAGGVADGTLVTLTLRDASTAVVDTRNVTVTGGVWNTSYDLSALADGGYDLSADVSDAAGNAAVQVVASFAKDTLAPSIEIQDPDPNAANSLYANAVNAAEAAGFIASGVASNAADAVQVVITATDGAAGSVSVTTGLTAGPGAQHSWTDALDISGLADGTITLTAEITDASGNGSSATTSFLKDTTAPAGYTASFDEDPVNIANQTAIGFTFANAEVGPGISGTDVTFAYTITSDGGAGSVTGTGTITAADQQVTGIDLSGLPDGTLTLSVTLTDFKGNTGAAATATTTKDATAPTLAIDAPIEGDDVVNAAEVATVVISGTSTDLPDATSVTIDVADGASGLVSGTATVSGGVWSVTLDLSALADGALSVTADATDPAGNPAPQATASASKDTVAPAGYAASLDDDPVNLANQTATGFTFAGAEVGATFAYSITSDGGGAAVTGTGTIVTATDQVTGLDLSGLGDGTLTLTVALTDPAGNTGADATDTAIKDATIPGVAIDAPIEDDDVINAAEALATVLSGTTTDLADGAVVTVEVSDGAAVATGTAAVSGGVWNLSIDLTGLADGVLLITADVSDAAGNPAPQATASATKDATAPSGYGIAFDQDPVNAGNQSAVGFTLSGAEVGATFAYSITSDGGGAAVTGTGTIVTATDQVTGLDLSGLGDGTLTISVALTDPAGNTGAAATGTATKDAVLPTAVLTGPTTAQADPFLVTLTFSEDVTGLTLASVQITNGTASALTGTGADYSFTVTPDHDGPVEISLDAGAAADAAGNLSTAAAAITVTADLTGTPNPVPLPDSDGDGVPDLFEVGNDRDGDGIPDDEDFDPQGYFYCEDDGRIIPGGGFTVTGPAGSNSSLGTANFINITRDGSTGEIQWFALRPGTYTMSLSYPTAVGIPSTSRLSSGALDLTTLLPSNPAVIGSTEFGSTGFLADASLAANPAFYTSFVIEPGDPFVLANNIPMTQCAENAVTLSAATDGAEANGGTPTDATFTVTQARISTQDTVISYTVAGTATSGADFTALSGTVTIPAGATLATITVPVLEDGDIEGAETVELTLGAVVSGDLTTILGTTLTQTATITDDDFADIAVVNVDLVTNEGGNDDATMTFALLGSPSSPVTLSFAGDSQCTVAPASLTFTAANYTTPQALTIRAIDDDKVEGTHSCQPTVVVSSADTRYDGAPLALAAVTVADDLVDQVRDPLTEILEEDLAETIDAQTRSFSRMAKGALTRLQAGRDLPCGTLQALDVNGSLQIQDASGTARGTFGSDVYNCATDTREILDGTFSLNKTEDTGLQALVQFAWQRERFTSDTSIAGYFLGGYYSRTDVSGLGDGAIDGFGVNGGVYGARGFGQGLFLDYYLAGAFGRHSYDIDFDTATAPINATGNYSYIAGFAGAGISGERTFDTFVMKPRVGIDFAYAKAGDSDVTAKQLGLTHTGVIEMDDFRGARATAEIRFESLGAPGGSEALASMMQTAFTPRLSCTLSSYDDAAECGVGMAFSWERREVASGLTWGFEVDVEKIDESRRFTFNIKRARPFANGLGSVVTRLSMPTEQTLQLEHGVTLDF
ncbi:hypothetical protein KUV73_16845 [Mameliella alba]|nr:hypothetical protein [Mameliella alba]MBY6171914.1 hypothetical protein [Mameliella alba]MBY6176042.1 hypothetical protein [Mameliella alba]